VTATVVEIHPRDPQPRLVAQVVEVLRGGGLIAYPTDSCYALGATIGSHSAVDRIRAIRHLDERHDFTLLCRDFSDLGHVVEVSNAVFRSVKAATPGPYTFVLPATREVPRRLQHPKKRTVGVRIPAHPVAQAILAALGEPMLTSTLLLPGDDDTPTEAWQVQERIGQDVDLVVDAGPCGIGPTTVVDLPGGEPVVVRVGAGDPARFE
jgi:tRNA threonylcarbamoyl adenosine modification protein (Sua5/YciO/YrdC/YwlC family)